jgi:ATP-dependent Clp protease ATP-binding subunit ClpC
VFHSLQKEEMKQIVDILLASLGKRTKEQMNITISVDDEAKEFIVDKGYDPKYGARPLRRTIQTEIEDRLAEEILDGKIFSGDEVIFTKENDSIKISTCRTINV